MLDSVTNLIPILIMDPLVERLGTSRVGLSINNYFSCFIHADVTLECCPLVRSPFKAQVAVVKGFCGKLNVK